MASSRATAPPTTTACEPRSRGWRRARLAQRDENYTRVFPSSLRVKTLAEASQIIEGEGARRGIQKDIREQMTTVARILTHADPDSGITTDELMAECGCSLPKLRVVFSALEAIGVATNDMRITVYVHVGVENNPSERRLAVTRELETALIGRASRGSARSGDGPVDPS